MSSSVSSPLASASQHRARSRSAALLALALGLTGCLQASDAPSPDLGDPSEVATSQTTQSLLVSSWSAPTPVSASAVWYAQVATLNGTTYMVHAGPGNVMSWRQLAGTTWTSPVTIAGQSTSTRVSLAAFNGSLYMVRTDLSQPTTLWVSHFSPATGQWSAAYQIPHTSLGGPPALVAYGSLLYLIGVDPSSKKLWSATMTSGEALSVASPMEGQYASARVSAAVYNRKLYIAHRAGPSGTIVYNSFNGTNWNGEQVVPAGFNGAPIQGNEPVIAERAGYLHLLHRDLSASTNNSQLWWTYFNGSRWPSEVTLGAQTTSYYPPALTTGGAGLVAIATTYSNSLASSFQFNAPLPLTVPAGRLGSQP